MLHVSGALHDHVETITAIYPNSRIWLRPIATRLSADGIDHHLDSIPQPLQRFFFRGRIWFGEFAGAVAYVSGLRYLGSDVVTQVTGEVQNEVAETVAVRKGFGPELFFGKRTRKFAYTRQIGGVAIGEDGY